MCKESSFIWLIEIFFLLLARIIREMFRSYKIDLVGKEEERFHSHVNKKLIINN